jgi:Ca2+-binding RTX toxin-like protein
MIPKRRGRPAVIVASVVALALGLAAVAVAATITGTAGPDTIHGTDEADTITSGRGNDDVFAHFGDDVVHAGAGADFVDAGTSSEDGDAICFFDTADDDEVNGAGGPDDLVGGDLCGAVGDPAAGDSDVLSGSGGADRIDVHDQVDEGADTANGGRGNDTCIGDADDTFLSCETIQVN